MPKSRSRRPKTGTHLALGVGHRHRAHCAGVSLVGQNYHSPDFVPYIGQSRGADTMITTGFAADGLTYGALAARLLAHQITGRDNPYADLYSARRVTPVKSAPRFIGEDVLVMKSFVQDCVTNRTTASLDELQPGSGAIVAHRGERVAGYGAADGR